ncbi:MULTISPECIES: helix-turn-helix domain-containing protein [Sphingomonas]|jgi:excisionase family DNA binding protein|uniref:helix-turn-helix domain-containing protein n=1 Tax=Sphingomonas TaxID=13687 RepID=UPI000B11F533|nr:MULTISPECIES: helix-turn-helix domain-containing protein [Sphingomonas]MBY0300795.1 helix-turn-helix domain-containing protein [Sphingomonas ginsenosidimutans]
MTNIYNLQRDTSTSSGSGDRLGRLAYSVPEASAAIGIGKTKLYALMTEGVLPSTLIGKRRLIRAADLEALIAGQFGRPT